MTKPIEEYSDFDLEKSLMISGAVFETNYCGLLKIVNKESCSKVLVEFLQTGYRRYALASAIRLGNVRDPYYPTVFGVGYIGEGKYKTSVNRKMTKEYIKWSGMLGRCYDKNNKRFHCYGGRGVTVCDEWLCFQTFAEWHNQNYIDGYQLDKDGGGGRIYSPETCQFVTHQKNVEISKAKTYYFIDPEGDEIEVYNLSKFCRKNKLAPNMMRAVFRGEMKDHRGYKPTKSIGD